jgi:hypothetical protein
MQKLNAKFWATIAQISVGYGDTAAGQSIFMVSGNDHVGLALETNV